MGFKTIFYTLPAEPVVEIDVGRFQTIHKGFGVGYYKDAREIYVAVDSVIFGYEDHELKLLMTRGNVHLPDKWSLIGGFVGPEENLDQAAQRVLQKLTGLSDVFIEQLYSFGDVNRVKQDRVITVAYYALIKNTDEVTACIEQNQSRWFPVKEPPKFEFDHKEIFLKALQRLRAKVRYQPVGFELLPEKFTIPQLKNLYETILDKSLDTRNFSRKLFSLDILINTGEKDKSGSKKGAWLYCFDKEKYDVLIAKGYNFEI